MLMKLTPRANFTNMFKCSFYMRRFQMSKNDSQVVDHFYAFGIYERKSCLWNVDEIDTCSSEGKK